MDRKVFFFIRSHGYQFAKDGFGMEGTAVDVAGGKKIRLPIERKNMAERLYRLTGSGIYVDSVRAGLLPPDSQLVAGDVVGCDSVMTASYRDKLYWFWAIQIDLIIPSAATFISLVPQQLAIWLPRSIRDHPSSSTLPTNKALYVRLPA